MERYGSELIFISRISGHGKSIGIIENEVTPEHRKSYLFKLNSLSISNETFIASGMSSYVVKIKNPPR